VGRGVNERIDEFIRESAKTYAADGVIVETSLEQRLCWPLYALTAK
jgi:hypothetical protein